MAHRGLIPFLRLMGRLFLPCIQPTLTSMRLLKLSCDNRQSTNAKRQFIGDIKVQGILQADTVRDLSLIDMANIKEYQSLLKQGNQAYPALNTFAQWLAQNHPSVDGITWYGYQRGEAGHRCYVFWGDRKNSIELKPRLVENLIDVSALAKLKDASLALDCALPENIVKFRI